MSSPRTFLKIAALTLAAAISGGSLLQAQGSGAWGGSASSPKRDDAAARLEWWRQRMNGDLSPEFMGRLMREAERQRQLYPERFDTSAMAPNLLPAGVPLPLAVSGTTWTSIGPSKSNKIQNGSFTRTDVNSGRMRNILPDTADVNTLYLLTAGGGLWKTTNFLNTPPTWTAMTDAVGSTAGGAASFGRVTTGAGTVLYVGMGDPFDLNVGGFVIKSTNAASTWSAPVTLTGARTVLDLKVDISTANDIVLAGTEIGLFRSTNGGTSFAAVADADVNGKQVWSLVKTSAGWLAATETVASPLTGALVLSTDLGATWTPVAGPGGAGRITLAVGAPGDATVYAYAADTDDVAQLDLYFSTNGGSTWTACNLTPKVPSNANGDQPNMDLMAGQAFYNHMVLVDPTDATRNTVYLGGQLSTARSTNAKAPASGSTWTLLTHWLPGSSPNPSSGAMPYAHADFHCAAFTNVGGTERLLFGNDGGLTVGTNRALGWNAWDHSKNIGISNHLIYTLASGPNDGCDSQAVLAGLQDNGTHNRVGGTLTYDQTLGGDGFGVGWSQATNAVSLGSYVYNAISRCTTNPPDDITKWSSFVGGLGTTGVGDNGTNYYFVTPIVTAPAGADAAGTTFYTYTNSGGGTRSRRIYRTTGGNWAQLGTLPNPGAGRLAVRAVSHGIGAHPTSSARLAAACTQGYVVTTTNTGGTWTARFLGTNGTNGQNIGWFGSSASVEWVNNTTLFACSEATNAGAAHVAKSTDTGATWTRSDTGIPDIPVTKILCDRGDATGNTLYAATWLGVYRTTNGGTSWSLFGTGLPQVRVTDIYVHPSSTFILASTWGRGVWQLGTSSAYNPPTITVQPQGGTYTVGVPFSLTVTATPAVPTLSYQWRKNGVNLANGGAEGISGATTATLTLATPTCTSNGNYDVVVTNCAGFATSNIAARTSTGTGLPFIQTQPRSGSFTPGVPFSLVVDAVGGGLAYQWRRNGVNLANGGAEGISGATGATLTLATPTCAASAGSYTVVVSNCAGSVTSNPAARTSTVPGPAITAQPPNTQFETGNAFSLPVVATGPGLTYQWTRNGVDLVNGAQPTWVVAGATTATLSITNAQSGTAGTYACRITSSGGCVTTTTNTSVVWGNAGNNWVTPNIMTNPADVTVLLPNAATFTVTAGGGRVDPISTRTFTFQWRRNGVNLANGGVYTGANVTVSSGQNNQMTSSLVVYPTTVALSGNFDCVVTTSSSTPGPATSAAAVLKVIQYTPATAVSITPSPALPVTTGTPVVFTAVGSGSTDGFGSDAPPSAYSYQFWVYWNDTVGWTMVQDYGVGSTYTLPGTTPPGTYGIGVDCRTSNTVLWDTFNSIDYFDVLAGPIRNTVPALSRPAVKSRPRFQGFATIR